MIYYLKKTKQTPEMRILSFEWICLISFWTSLCFFFFIIKIEIFNRKIRLIKIQIKYPKLKKINIQMSLMDYQGWLKP